MGTRDPSTSGWRERLDRALFRPESRREWMVYWGFITLIVFSVFEFAAATQYEEYRQEWTTVRLWLHGVLVTIFTIEIVLRVIARPSPRQYLFRWEGLVDLAAVLPALFAFVLPFAAYDSAWLRALRLLRLLRIAKLLQHVKTAGNEHLEILARLAPYFAIGLAAKTVFLFLEYVGYWPRIEGLEIVMTVIGFAIGILLSTRLATVHGRTYTFDERVEHLTGSVEAARPYVTDDRNLFVWLRKIYDIVASGGTERGFDEANEKLLRSEGGNIPGPIYNALHQNAQFLVHRVRTRTPRVYTRLLTRITVIYMALVIATIPGLTGLISTLLVIYVLGGMTLIVEFMDQPFDPSQDSLINSDISGLERYLTHHGWL